MEPKAEPAQASRRCPSPFKLRSMVQSRRRRSRHRVAAECCGSVPAYLSEMPFRGRASVRRSTAARSAADATVAAPHPATCVVGATRPRRRTRREGSLRRGRSAPPTRRPGSGRRDESCRASAPIRGTEHARNTTMRHNGAVKTKEATATPAARCWAAKSAVVAVAIPAVIAAGPLRRRGWVGALPVAQRVVVEGPVVGVRTARYCRPCAELP